VSDELNRLREENAQLREQLRAAAAFRGAVVREVPPLPEEYLDAPDPDACPRCAGSGMVDAPPGDMARKWPCDDCDMTGQKGGA
jgi:hypothetical protein